MVLRPCALYKSLITFPSLKWMRCQSWGFLRWPGLGGFFRFLVIALLWTMFSEIHFILFSSMYPTLCVGDRSLPKRLKSVDDFGFGSSSSSKMSSYAMQVHHGSLYVNSVEQQENFIAE
ncbi:Plastidic type i signal peptidase 1 isoform 2 [Hibiscus syriacus]|uniref:Plastidic type i signal peptidase 1 isoform 2 n=1 Tax=Hibiscus syriacus TaxID=106335 RepID=A0A6A3B4E6_HIBSY|nr:Plastidic type i signal peptidase 1 isoform 2 [Hibiscus syriacus]